jgi:peptide/nickel transport system substrate-binding protein
MSDPRGMTRRDMLRLSLVAGAAAWAAPLVACSTDTKSEAGSAAKRSAAPTLLRIGAFDETNTAGLDPRTASNGASLIVLYHVYDALMVLTQDGYQMQLAESVEPNADGSEWTIRIRNGAKFHDGRPVTAKDVVYSLRTLGTPPSNRATVYATVDLAGMRAVDARTVRVPMRQPRGDFREAVLSVYSVVFPDGTKDFSKGIGSGPYRLAGSDAQTVRLVATGDHWSGQPRLQELRISRIADPAARLNAVKGGQLDYSVQISATGARAERADKRVVVRRGGAANANALSFAMNMQLKPFDDPRVRRAVRLAADRQALVDHALLGYGTVGADVVGKGLPGYAKGITDRQRDVATAKQLFSAAGVRELTIRAAEIVPGMMAAVQLFAQQLAEAGVKLNVQQVPPDTFYADITTLATHPFQTFYYVNRPAALHLSAVTAKGVPFNVIGTGADYQRRLAAAQAIVDDARREAAFEALQMELYENGGDLLWGYQEMIDASKPGVSGVRSVGLVPNFTHAALA